MKHEEAEPSGELSGERVGGVSRKSPKRIWFRSDQLPRRMAKLMKKRANQIGVEMKLTFAQHTIARLYGYRNWVDLKSVTGQGAPCQQRQPAIPEVDTLERQYVQRLSLLLGIEADVSQDLYDSFRRLQEIAESPETFRPRDRTDEAPLKARSVVIVRKKVRHVASSKRLIDLT